MEIRAHPPGLQDVLEFPLLEALYGRRARRFSLGASLPDGPLAFTSRHHPLPLTELEQMLVLTAAAGNTGWHYMIMRHAGHAPHLSNYSGAAGGRTFPSAAGFHRDDAASGFVLLGPPHDLYYAPVVEEARNLALLSPKSTRLAQAGS